MDNPEKLATLGTQDTGYRNMYINEIYSVMVQGYKKKHKATYHCKLM